VRKKGAKMPHSLRAKIKGLRYKGIITDKDCERLCKALDNENVLDKIREEINRLIRYYPYPVVSPYQTNYYAMLMKDEVLQIIDKYNKEEGE
jgi:hypothetical protein